MKKTQDPLTIFRIFLILGLTSFGGPVAHIGYFREAFVEQRGWLSDGQFADLVALCNFLPGPSSSQVGLSIGLLRGGYRGAFAAWFGFTLPSVLVMVAFALSLSGTWSLPNGILAGLKIAAVAVVAHAIWGMAKTLCPDLSRQSLAVVCAVIALLLPSVWGQIGVVVLCAIFGLAFRIDQVNAPEAEAKNMTDLVVSPRVGLVCLLTFIILLVGLPLLMGVWHTDLLSLITVNYQSGALVFGGGHVILPLLQSAFVPSGMVSGNEFIAGYGVAQAIPGPLFTFASFLGAINTSSVTGWFGGVVATLGIFLPSFLLVFGVLPFWQQLRQYDRVGRALCAVNAGVVGLLVAAFYLPVWSSTIVQSSDFALALVAFALLMWWRFPSWLVVIICAFVGFIVF